MAARSLPKRLCLAAIIGVFCSTAGMDSSSAGESQKSPWKGREVFRQKGCVDCHSIHGEGGDEGPDLGERRFYGTYLEMAALMWNHLPKMMERMEKAQRALPRLTADEMGHLVSFLARMRFAADRGNERRGRKLLRSKRCTACHKFGGEGGDIGPDLTTKNEYLAPVAFLEAMWNHGPAMMEYFEEQNIKPPRFQRNEAADLAAGIRSYMSPTKVPVWAHELGDAKHGQKLVQERGCLRCHSIRGEGGGDAPDFARIHFDYSAMKIAGRLWNHGPKMWEAMKSHGIEFPVFRRGEMADVIAYLYELRIEDKAGDSEKGRRVIERQCLKCHELNGKGAGITVDLATLSTLESPLQMITSMWNHGPDMRRVQLEEKVQWPKLTARDMADLYAFLRTEPTPPRH